MAPPILEPETDDLFHCSLISIQVENRLFKVPRELFETYSEVFQNMFSLPGASDSNSDAPQDGDGDDKPLFLDGIKKEDFRSFLTVLSARHYEAVTTGKVAGKTSLLLTRFPLYPPMANDAWIATLRLSHMWGFENVRTKAIEVLDADATVGIIQRLKLANEFQITNWLRPAYQYLITRNEGLKETEVPWLGADFVQKVTKA